MDHAEVIGALIGLCGAVSNNGKTEQTDAVVRLALLHPEQNGMADQIRKEKYRIAPNCAVCETPCGNTADYDMERFYDAPEEVVESKLAVIRALKQTVQADQENRQSSCKLPDGVYRAIACLGYELDAESYQKLKEELEYDSTDHSYR